MSDYIHTRLKVSEAHGVKMCLFDEEGVELYDRYIWTTHKQGKTFYLIRCKTVDGKPTIIYFHRELLGLEDGEIRDHRNGNGLDDRTCNLRPATHQENMCNQGIYKNNTSGVKGVWRHKVNQKWIAQISYKDKKYSLGSFANKDEAERVVRAKREELHGEFCNHG